MSGYAFVFAGAVLGFLSVGMGAFGAHALSEKLKLAAFVTYQTAVQYQFFHALALLAVGILSLNQNDPLLKWAGTAILAGILIFSGTLYLIAFTGTRWYGAITPVGGVSLLIGWALLSAFAWKRWMG
ncbi:DUF423 domain-containing protein [bacterium]|jgi:uncharacterized membrane protein YgdD (TMEM256/DUF423 family)|nr:DUF423 domain-containing protein [bacterium]